MVLTSSGLGAFCASRLWALCDIKGRYFSHDAPAGSGDGPNIRVNAVAPAAVDTAFLRGGTGRSDEQGAPRFDMDAYAASIPLGRIALPEDIAGPILFLLSDAAGYITGQTLHINGGSFMA